TLKTPHGSCARPEQVSQRAATLRCRACDRGTKFFLRRGNVRAGGQRDSVLDRGNLGENRYRDFRRCAAADVQAYGAVKTSDLLRRQVEFTQALTPLGVVGARAECTDIERRR